MCKQEASCRNSILLTASACAKVLGKKSGSSVEGATGKCVSGKERLYDRWEGQRRRQGQIPWGLSPKSARKLFWDI